MYATKSLSTPRAFLAITALTLIICLTACKSAPPATPTDDASLTAALQGRIAGDGALSNEPIQSAVQDRVATLSGTVSSDAARSLAAADASQVAPPQPSQNPHRSSAKPNHPPPSSVTSPSHPAPRFLSASPRPSTAPPPNKAISSPAPSPPTSSSTASSSFVRARPSPAASPPSRKPPTTKAAPCSPSNSPASTAAVKCITT